jgi:hypothetical protein
MLLQWLAILGVSISVNSSVLEVLRALEPMLHYDSSCLYTPPMKNVTQLTRTVPRSHRNKNIEQPRPLLHMPPQRLQILFLGSAILCSISKFTLYIICRGQLYCVVVVENPESFPIAGDPVPARAEPRPTRSRTTTDIAPTLALALTLVLALAHRRSWENK